MDKFQSILIFTTVAEMSGFTAAADRLNMSPSNVTKNVAALERDLGVQLFTRSTRHVALTDLGREYYQQCSEILTSLRTAEDTIRDHSSEQRGTVRIVMPYSFGRVTFVPELPRFREMYPAIDLDIHFSDEPVDIIRQGFDLAVLARDLEDSSLISRVLHRGPELTVASPAYLARNPAPSSPWELDHHNCIIGNFGNNWRFQSEDGSVFSVRVSGSDTLHNGDAVLTAAVGGLGIAQSTWWLFRKELERGTLVPVLENYQRPGFPISVIYPAKRIPARTNIVIGFLAELTRVVQPQAV